MWTEQALVWGEDASNQSCRDSQARGALPEMVSVQSDGIQRTPEAHDLNMPRTSRDSSSLRVMNKGLEQRRVLSWGRSSDGLECYPVTVEVTGSNPAAPANFRRRKWKYILTQT